MGARSSLGIRGAAWRWGEQELGERIGVWTGVADRGVPDAVNGWDLCDSWDLWGGSLVPSVA
jgi:hypothetical protein